MSALFIITPIITAAWPAFAGAVAGAAGALGFSLAAKRHSETPAKKSESVEIDLKNSSIVTESLDKAEEISFDREDITVTFKKDVRGHCAISVSGTDKTREELQEIGSEISRKVIQEYVRSRVVSELKRKGFELAEEEVTADRTIRLTIRKWR